VAGALDIWRERKPSYLDFGDFPDRLVAST
jgi:hypothetical protein